MPSLVGCSDTDPLHPQMVRQECVNRDLVKIIWTPSEDIILLIHLCKCSIYMIYEYHIWYILHDIYVICKKNQSWALDPESFCRPKVQFPVNQIELFIEVFTFPFQIPKLFCVFLCVMLHWGSTLSLWTLSMDWVAAVRDQTSPDLRSLWCVG